MLALSVAPLGETSAAAPGFVLGLLAIHTAYVRAMTHGVGVPRSGQRAQRAGVNVSDARPNSISVMFGDELLISLVLSRNAVAPWSEPSCIVK